MDNERNAQRAVGEEKAPDHARQGVIVGGPDARSRADGDKTSDTKSGDATKTSGDKG